MKSKFKITRADYLKAMRKARRDEEIREHLHPVNINRVHKSKKVYNRKRNKADLNKDLHYFLPSASYRLASYRFLQLLSFSFYLLTFIFQGGSLFHFQFSILHFQLFQ